MSKKSAIAVPAIRFSINKLDSQELLGVVTVLQNDVYHTQDVKAKVDQTAQDTIAATRIIDGFRNPQQNGHFLKTHASFPLE
jgi:nucleoporin p58/p45